METNRIPLVVGVTGHRDLRGEDIPRLEKKVREILADLKNRHPMTPLVVLSSLAEGADQLVARVGLEYKAQLIAPLPMPVDEYRKDFTSETTRKGFDDLLAHATETFAVAYGPGVTAQNIEDPAHRAEQYAKAGHYILRHCHILLALWDSDKVEKTGGTSQIVRHRLSGFLMTEMPEWTVLNPPDSGTVFQVITPRESNPQPEGAFTLQKYYANPRFSAEIEENNETTEEKAGKIFASLLKRTDGFNRDVNRLGGELSAEFKKSRSSLEPGHLPGQVDKNLTMLLNRFAAADVLATHYQKKRHRSLAQVCFLALESPVCLAAYHTVDSQHSAMGLLFLAAFFIAIGWAFCAYFIAKINAYETKHLDYRALAEGLKVLFFWRLAGIQDDVGAQYLRKQRSEVDWIRLALRASDLLTSPRAVSVETYAWIKTHWMDDELGYFDRSATHNRKLDEGFRLGARVFVKAGVIMAAMMLSVHAFNFYNHRDLPELYARRFHLLSVIIVGSLAAGGALTAYAEKLAFAQHSKQYGQMRRLFAMAIREYSACLGKGEIDHVRSIIRRLGHEALRENGDWVLLHRERPMEIKLG